MKQATLPALLAGLLLGAFLVGCGMRDELLGGRVKGASGRAMAEAMSAEEPAVSRSAAQAPSPDAVGGFAAEPTATEADQDALAATTGSDQSTARRRRIYSGYARLRVGSTLEAKDSLARMAEEAGGYVESSAGDTVSLRVPAADFDDFFAQVLSLGEVIERRVETFDVTEQYQDLAARLAVARRTRERLYELLGRTTDVEERLALLREIRRLTEQIERIELSLELLERQIAFSRITVQLVPRLADEATLRGAIPFGWIADLDPLYASLRRLRARVGITLPEDFAIFERERTFRAESPEGTRVRVGTTANEPRGDGAFWSNALTHHLAPLYRTVEAVSLGQLEGVLLTSKDREPFSFLVAVKAEGRRLHVVEVFFPDPAALRTRLSEIEDALAAAEVR
jgi:hypothetical protein